MSEQSELEITEIESALQTEFDAVRTHLQRALELLADRSAPDYRNSIKESISAVEAVTKLTTGNAKGTFSQLLNSLPGIHPPLRAAFEKLYAFTCDAHGIRHALIETETLTLREAKFMIVACSAFVNFVIAAAPSTESSAPPE